MMNKMGFVATEIKFCDFSFNSIWKRELGFWIWLILKDGNMFDNQKKEIDCFVIIIDIKKRW